ncbi:Protein FAR-RED IMPAIRED RESPONSE 1 [Bienertia sinuspersici]
MLCNETDFLKKLSEVVWNRDLEPEESDVGWHSVMSEFGLQNHEWFVKMFEKKDQWIPSYFRNLFMGGILRSSKISESENNFFTQFTNANCLLVELRFRYESAMDCQRHTQDKLNSDTKNSIPRLFQHEFQHAVFNCGVLTANSFEGIDKFEVNDNTRKKNYSVTCVVDGANYFCSCKMFESMGLLCRHILFVMKGKFLSEIPNQYVLNRWTKDALKKPLYNFCGNLEGVEKVEKHKVVGDIWSKFFSCVSLVEDNPGHLNLLLKKLTVIEKELEAEKYEDHEHSKEKHMELLLGSKDIELNILPPEKSSNKGSGSGKQNKSVQEIATETHKKHRLCRSCGQLSNHDSRNCPHKGKNVE